MYSEQFREKGTDSKLRKHKWDVVGDSQHVQLTCVVFIDGFVPGTVL